MNGNKGGMRDRIISFLFSNKNEDTPDRKDDFTKKDETKTNINNLVPVADKDEDYSLEKTSEFVPIQLNEKENTSKDIAFTYEEPVKEQENKNNDLPQQTISKQEDYSLENTSEFIPVQLNENTKDEEKEQYTHTTDSNDLSKEEKPQLEEQQEVIEQQVEEQPIELDDNNEVMEKTVVDALERIIKEDIYELEQIQYELEVLKDKEEDEALTEEVEKSKKKLEELIKKFEKIKAVYYKAIDREELKKIDDDELYRLVSEFKDDYKDKNLLEIVETEIKVVESYVSLIEQITSIEKSKDKIDEKLDKKLDKFQIRDEEFEEMKKDYENLEEINDVIESFNKEQERILKELEEKMKNSEKITSKVERTVNLVPHLNRMIQSAIMISMSKRIPPTPRGNLIKAGLIISAISLAAHSITTEEKQKTVTTIKYQDFSSDLKTIGKDINNIISKIDDAFGDIHFIRENFKKTCEDYQGQIPEYDEFMNKLDTVEKELKEKQDIAKKYNKDFNNMLEKNNARVKRLEKQDNATLVTT